jgi:hypothetical protein
MADLVVVIGTLAFFAIAALFIMGCDRIIGPDPSPADVGGDASIGGDAGAERADSAEVTS